MMTLDSRLGPIIPSSLPPPKPCSIEKQVKEDTSQGVTSLLSSPALIPFISASFPNVFGGEGLSDSLPACRFFPFPCSCFCLSYAPLVSRLSSSLCSAFISLFPPQASPFHTPSLLHSVAYPDLTQRLTLFSSWSRQRASSWGASWIEFIRTRPWGVTSP